MNRTFNIHMILLFFAVWGVAKKGRQWFDQCIISKMILKGGSNWLFPVVFSVEITLSGSHSGNSFEFNHILNPTIWVSDCCLAPIQQFFSYIMARTSKFSMPMRWSTSTSYDAPSIVMTMHRREQTTYLQLINKKEKRKKEMMMRASFL
jgi:hypothetical protein